MANIVLEDLISEDNIAELLDEDSLKSIGRDVVEGYEEDLSSCQEWLDTNEDYVKLASQVKEEKNYPWPNAANVNYPLLTTAATNFQARWYPALIPNYNVAKGRVIGFDKDGTKAKKAINIGKHMSYQLLEQMTDWEEGMDKLGIILPIVGCAFKKTYYDPIEGQNTSDLVLPQDLILNYYSKSVEKAYRKTHRILLTTNDIHERIAEGIYSDLKVATPETSEGVVDVREEVSKLTQPSMVDGSTPALLLEQHTYLDLDDDGYAEPYIVTVDEKTQQVYRIIARYDEEGIKRNANGDVIRVRAVEYFTKYGFIPNPDGGIYDLGFGPLLTPINDTVNTTINQLLDAGTLANLQGGFLSRGIRMKGGVSSFQPGEWKTVNATGDDLRKGIVPLPSREPSAVLFNLLNLMINAGQRLSSTVDVMVGEDSGQNQKATTTMTKLQEGMRVFSAIIKRSHRSLKSELKKLARLNSIYLEEEEYFTILDPGKEEITQIGRSDYKDNLADIIPAADPNVATEQMRMAKAQALFELLPLGTVSPVEVTKRNLEAQDQYDVEGLMNVPPPQPSQEDQLAVAEFQHKAAIEIEEQKRKNLDTRAKGLLAVAQAESLEKGQQLELYKTMLLELGNDVEREREEEKAGAEANENAGEAVE